MGTVFQSTFILLPFTLLIPLHTLNWTLVLYIQYTALIYLSVELVLKCYIKNKNSWTDTSHIWHWPSGMYTHTHICKHTHICQPWSSAFIPCIYTVHVILHFFCVCSICRAICKVNKQTHRAHANLRSVHYSASPPAWLPVMSWCEMPLSKHEWN